jgi:hypothetical protein
MSIYFLLFWSSLAIVSYGSFRWGGKPERLVAIMFFGAAIATSLLRPAVAFRYRDVEIGVFLIDACLLAGLVWVTVRADRWWPLCATALQILTVLSHVGKALNPALWRYGYQLMATWAAWPMVAVLAVGVLRQRSRMAKQGGTLPG